MGRTFAALCVATAALPSCGGSDDAATVTVELVAFSPATLEVDAGDGMFDGEMDGADASYSFTFDEPCRYAYFCRVHESMTGEIVVR